jgi:hypothetical protein
MENYRTNTNLGKIEKTHDEVMLVSGYRMVDIDY